MQLEVVSTSYENIRAVNWSSLKYLSTSPLLYRWMLEHAAPPKRSFVFGGAVHCAALEPELFDARYAVFDGKRDERTEVWRCWKANHPGVIALKSAEMERVNIVSAAILSHRVARDLLRGGRREEALTWTDEATGLACKGRVDFIRPDLVVDLKTARDVSPRHFQRATADYGYAAQVAFYHDGAMQRRLIDGNERPYIIAAQHSPPFDVVVFQLVREALEAGRLLYRSLLRRLIECTEADYFPGIAPEVQPLSLPLWADAQFLQQPDDSEEF